MKCTCAYFDVTVTASEILKNYLLEIKYKKSLRIQKYKMFCLKYLIDWTDHCNQFFPIIII